MARGLALVLAFAGFATSTPAAAKARVADARQPVRNVKKTKSCNEGTASFYAAFHQGRKTANGERFNMHALTAAHKTLPFGTRVRVTNLRNGRSVIVRINDRGPYVRGRIMDVTREAARQLGFVNSGIARVRIESVDPGVVLGCR